MRNLASFFIACVSAFVMAAEDSKYDFSWLDQDKEVYVLQNRKFRKDGTFSLSLMGGVNTSNAFSNAYSAQLRANYFFTEEWGIEVLYDVTMNTENDAYKAVKNTSAVPFSRTIKNYYAGMLLWSPFYAKINTFNKVVYFDVILGVGAAKIDTEDNRNKVDTSLLKAGNDSYTGAVWDIGCRFYITPTWSARIDVTALHYNGKIYGQGGIRDEAWDSNYDLFLGVNYTF